MGEKLYEALEVCLQAIETGADPESAVKLFPEMEEQLLPLLETSRQAKSLAIPVVPERVLRRNKARVLQHASMMRTSAGRQPKQMAFFTFPRLAISLAFALLFLLSGTNLVRASNGALPGDQLYPVKRTWEDVRLLLVFSPASRQELESEFEQERLHEVDELLAEGRHETIRFAGVVTEQKGDLWIISGVPVQVTAESRTPVTPVLVGASVLLEGRTNAQGFVEADFIELLDSDVFLPTAVPTQIDAREEHSGLRILSSGENEAGSQDDSPSASSFNEDRPNGVGEANSDNGGEDSRSGKNGDESNPDRSGEDRDRNGKDRSEGGSDGNNGDQRENRQED